MGVGTKLAAPIALLAALAGAQPATAQEQRDCFWQGGTRSTNIAYPDLGARYWVSSFPLPPGAELVLRGRYPHARYMSFNVYDAAAQPTDGLADVDVAPDAGSSNPFAAGAQRDVAGRGYTVRVVSGARPDRREPNTIYLNAGGQPSAVGVIIYRVYVADSGRDVSGGVGLPEVSMRLPSGRELDQPATCESRADTGANQAVEAFHANADGPGADPRDPTVEDPIRWEAFFNYFQAFSYPAQATPAAAVREAVVPRERLGGFLSNVDNAYTIASANRGVGPVLVVEGRAPVTPRTLDGRRVMEGGQVRYWSLCENEVASQRVIDCVYDEQVRTDPSGRFRLVMSTPGDRPANATPECGTSWIAWGVQPDGLLILRHMLPSVSFAQAIQRVSEPGTERAVVGEYLPVGRHTTKAEFESRGCAPSASGAGAAPARPARPRIRLSVVPARARFGRAVRFRFLATYRAAGRVHRLAGARVRFANEVGTTNARGRVTIVQRFTHARGYRPRGCHAGFACGRAAVRVVR
ncbi:MAG TPA: hypothetical protein VF520_05325 [Thermoleophilaceae bacterium]|jgi:hypothetical protein